MKLTIKNTTVTEEEVEITLPLFWKFDNWYSKLEENIFSTIEDEVQTLNLKIQLTSVTINSISCILMTLQQFEAHYGHYRGLYEEITEQEYQIEFDKLNNYLK